MAQQVREIYLYDGSVAREKILESLREAKVKLGWEFLLKPVWVDSSFERVIAFEEPKLLMDHILIGPEIDSDELLDAMRWSVLGEYSEAVVPISTTLGMWFGDFGVRELDPSEMKEYTQQQDLKKASHRLKFEVKGDSRDGYR